VALSPGKYTNVCSKIVNRFRGNVVHLISTTVLFTDLSISVFKDPKRVSTSNCYHVQIMPEFFQYKDLKMLVRIIIS
jgi:hypothetical protein